MTQNIARNYLERTLTASVYDVAKETPLDEAHQLSQRLGNRVLLKREDLQPIFSFKIRGAYNKISLLPEKLRAKGVIAASAGNHGQGVALAAAHLNIDATIVMPVTTPVIKVEATKRFGKNIDLVLHGDTYDEAYAHARQLEQERGLTFVHPYDDPDVIAGQATIAMEILRQHPRDIHAIFVPVGGGGLIGGIAAYVKSLRPEIKIIGVEPKDAATLHDALRANKRVILDQVGIFADGVAVRQIGVEAFAIAKQWVDEVILVDTDEICAAIKDIYENIRSIPEPAGALSVAGIKRYVERTGCTQKNCIGIISGANINFDRLRHVAERAELGEGREVLLAVTIPEVPGSFRAFCSALGKHSVTEFNYRHANSPKAHVFVGIRLDTASAELDRLIDNLTANHYKVLNITDNEAAKLHLRYTVGGRSPQVKNELLMRFQFPERPGALLEFLEKMGTEWNISMFHYRNHGAAYGRVLVGAQLPEGQRDQFHEFIQEVGYRYWDETNNPACQLFLR